MKRASPTPAPPGIPLQGSTGIPPQDSFGAALRGFGPVGIVAMLLIVFGNFQFRAGSSPFPIVVPLGAVLALAWAWRSRTPWRDIGYARPRSWPAAVAVGIAAGCALKLVMKAVVMPLLGADAVNPHYHFLAGNQAAITYALFAMIVGAGFGEETVFRGYLFERLGKLLGPRPGATTAIVLLTSLWFGLAHYTGQGVAGVQNATISGLVFGGVYVATGRIWVPMIMHAAFNLTAYALIYWELESRVAHLFFA